MNIQNKQYRDADGRKVWFGIIELSPTPACEILGREAGGAFVPLLALSHNEKMFRREVDDFAEYYNAIVKEVFDIEPFEDKLARDNPSDTLMTKAKEAIQTGTPRCGDFEVYPLDDS